MWNPESKTLLDYLTWGDSVVKRRLTGHPRYYAGACLMSVTGSFDLLEIKIDFNAYRRFSIFFNIFLHPLVCEFNLVF